MSPESFCNSEEVDEVLSLLSSDSVTPLEANDAFDVFPSPSSAVNYGYNDNCKLSRSESIWGVVLLLPCQAVTPSCMTDHPTL